MRTKICWTLLLTMTSLIACDAGPDAPEVEAGTAEPGARARGEGDRPGVIDIRAEDYAFVGPPTLPSGWVTLRFENAGAEPHFLLLWDLPDGKTFDDYDREVGKPFEDLYVEYRAGRLDREAFFEQLIEAIPEWFYEAVPMGGPGFVSPGRTSETTLFLTSGDNYVMECYVRASIQDDTFHGTHGMLRPLIVTEEDSGLEPPAADVDIDLSSFEVEQRGELSAGRQVVRVGVADTPEGFIRHNVHLVKLEEGMTADEVAPWLDWVDAMLAPEPAVFLGGAGQTVAGRDTYLTLDLQPGRYAWVSESFGIQGMVREVTVE